MGREMGGGLHFGSHAGMEMLMQTRGVDRMGGFGGLGHREESQGGVLACWWVVGWTGRVNGDGSMV